MMRSASLFGGLFLFIGSALAQSLDERFSEIYHLARKLERAPGTDRQKGEALEAAYLKHIPHELSSSALQTYGHAELKLLFRSNAEVASASKGTRYALNLELIFNALKERGIANSAQAEELYDAFIRSRLFDKAATFIAEKYFVPSVRLPTFQIAADAVDGVPTEWVISETSRVAERRKANLSAPWLMVVVSHPHCHFSKNAAISILADTGLAARLKGHSKWVTPQDANFDFDDFQKWNRKYPDAAQTVVHRSDEWPMERFNATPIFYFLANGKVVSSFSGWPKEGNKEQLLAALAQVEPKKN